MVQHRRSHGETKCSRRHEWLASHFVPSIRGGRTPSRPDKRENRTGYTYKVSGLAVWSLLPQVIKSGPQASSPRRLLIRAYSWGPPYHPTTYPLGRTEQSHVPAGHSPP